MSLLEQKTTKKEPMDKNIIEFEAASNNKEYKVNVIWDSSVYANKAKGHVPSLYYLVA